MNSRCNGTADLDRMNISIRDEDFENVDAGKPRILIPIEGRYHAQFIRYEAKSYVPWGEKLIFHWNIFISADGIQCVSICRFYNLKRKPGGQFCFGPGHDFYKDYIAANRGKLPMNPSRLPISLFRQGRFVIEVVTVRTDLQARALSSSCYWSKVGRIIRPVEEGEVWERCPL